MTLAVVLALGGCSALTVPDAPPVSTPISPVWDAALAARHLTFLQSEVVRGRADATLGYTIAAAYLADRMREYGLQPGSGSDFRIIHVAPRNVVSGALLRFADSDTADFVLGRDFLPDGRSDSFSGTIGSFRLNDVASVENEKGGSLLWIGNLASNEESRLRRAGLGVLMQQTSLEPRPSASRWEGTAFLQVTPRAVRVLVGESRADPSDPTLRYPDRPLQLDVVTASSRTAPGINVVGFVPGKHPEYADEAVILCTHLDAIGRFAGLNMLDLRNFGVEVAAVLEVARQFARFANYLQIPERTLIIAFVSGSTVDGSGLRALLASPLWKRDKVRAIFYAGDPDFVRARGELAAESPIPLKTIQARPTAMLPDTVLIIPRGAGRHGASRETERSTRPQDYVAPAAEASMELADRLFIYVAGEAMVRSTKSGEPAVDTGRTNAKVRGTSLPTRRD